MWETYTLNGKKHNPNGPAVNVTYVNGVIAREEYYLYGIARENGFAAITRFFDGSVACCWYSVEGKLVEK